MIEVNIKPTNINMRIVFQRVQKAEVRVVNEVTGKIDHGALIFLGVAKDDTVENADYLIDKITQLRVFEDGQGKMNLSATDVKASFLVVSQFTLYGDCRKGRRPSFDKAADPAKAEELYEYFVDKLKEKGFSVETGRFAAMMDVELINDGPVTFVLEK